MYRAVAAQLKTFLARQRRRERGQDRLVAYSCKGRAFCSSCGGRRMADTAAHLVDRVLPPAAVRQWVLSLPFALRYRLAYDARLVRDVLQVFVQTVFASTRRRARERHGRLLERREPHTGSRPRGCRPALARRAAARRAELRLGPRCAEVEGVSVHANVAVPARDRERLERLCRYVARPAVATDRLSLLDDGRVLYAPRHRWRDGTTHVAFEPLEFVEKLAALVPPPRFNLTRYHGVFAPASRLRAHIVPEGPDPESSTASHSGCPARNSADAPADAASRPGVEGSAVPRNRPRPRNYSWAELMQRVWAIDVLECSECHGRLRIIASLHSPEASS